MNSEKIIFVLSLCIFPFSYGMQTSFTIEERTEFYSYLKDKNIKKLEEWHQTGKSLEVKSLNPDGKLHYPLHEMCTEIIRESESWPLWQEPSYQSLELLSRFLNHGANPNISGEHGITPAHELMVGLCGFMSKKTFDVALKALQLLKEHGADFAITRADPDPELSAHQTLLHRFHSIIVYDIACERKVAQLINFILTSCNTHKFHDSEIRRIILYATCQTAGLYSNSRPKYAYHILSTFLTHLPVKKTREMIGKVGTCDPTIFRIGADYLDQTEIFDAFDDQNYIHHLPKELRQLLTPLVIANNVVKEYYDEVGKQL